MKIEIRLKTEALTLDSVVEPGAGAVSRFDGIVRGIEKGIPITGLEYEAYAPMAEQVIREILEELGRAHPFHLVRVHHRLGFVPVGESAIIMDVHSKHRAEAFAVLTKFLDRLKQDVPIWKRGAGDASLRFGCAPAPNICLSHFPMRYRAGFPPANVNDGGQDAHALLV